MMIHEDEEEKHVEFDPQVFTDEGFMVNSRISVTDGSITRSMEAGTSPKVDRNISKITAKSKKITPARQDKKSEFNTDYEAVKNLKTEKAETKAVQIHGEGADSEQGSLEELEETETVTKLSVTKTDPPIQNILETERKAFQIRPTSKQFPIKNETKVEHIKAKELVKRIQENNANVSYITDITEKPQILEKTSETESTQTCQGGFDKYGSSEVKTQEFEKVEALDQQKPPDTINVDLKSHKTTYPEVRKHNRDHKPDFAAEKICKDNKEKEEAILLQRLKDKTQKVEQLTKKEPEGEFRDVASNKKSMLEQEMQKNLERDMKRTERLRQSSQTKDELQLVQVKEGQTSQTEELQTDAAKEHRPSKAVQHDTSELLEYEEVDEDIQTKDQMSITPESFRDPVVQGSHYDFQMTSMKKQETKKLVTDQIQSMTASCEVDKKESTLEELNKITEKKADQGILRGQDEIDGMVSKESSDKSSTETYKMEAYSVPPSREIKNKTPYRSAVHMKTEPEQSRTKKDTLGSTETVQESFGKKKKADRIKDENEKSSSPLTTKLRRESQLDEGTSVQSRPDDNGDDTVSCFPVTQTDMLSQREPRQTTQTGTEGISNSISEEKLTLQPQTESVNNVLNMKQREIQTSVSPVMRAAQKRLQTSEDVVLEITEKFRSGDVSVKIPQKFTKDEVQNSAEEVEVTDRRLRNLRDCKESDKVASTDKHPVAESTSQDAPGKQMRTQEVPLTHQTAKQSLDKTESTGSQVATPEHMSGIPGPLVISRETVGAEEWSRRTEPVRTKQELMKKEPERGNFHDDKSTSIAPQTEVQVGVSLHYEPSVTDNTAVLKTQPSKTEPDILKTKSLPPPKHETLMRQKAQKVQSFTETNAPSGTEGNHP